ncbi:MAG: cell division protein PerM, partial [Sciscionella sp.]
MTLLQSPPQTQDESERPPVTSSRGASVRTLGLAALCPLLAGYAALAALLALVSALASDASFAANNVLLAAGPGWLAAWHVPIEIDGRPLGVLPLLLTGLVLLLAERAAAGTADRLGPGRPMDAIPPVAAIAGAHAVFGGLIALLCGSGPVTAAPAAAFFTCGVLAALAATFGVRRRYGLVDAVVERMDTAVRLGLRTGRIALLALFGAGALVFLVAVVASFGTVRGLFARTAPGVGNEFGLLLLSLGYLPNVLIGATS